MRSVPLAAASVLLAALFAPVPMSPAAGPCTVQVAADAGGRALQQAVSGLDRGATLCLQAGTFDVRDRNLTLDRPGTQLRAAPGHRPRILGRIVITADQVTLRGLRLDGRNPRGLPSPTINASHVRLISNDITNRNTAICVAINDYYGPRPRGVHITRNRIHRCGRLPATNHDHGIYVEAADGTRITDNIIERNADRGVQLYPDARRTVIAYNLIRRNGQGIIFGGEDGRSSSFNRVHHNTITHAVLRGNVESWYPRGTAPGRGNRVTGNCVWGGAHAGRYRQGINLDAGGFTATENWPRPPKGGCPKPRGPVGAR